MKILMVCKGHYHHIMPNIAEVLRHQYGATVSAMTFATVTAQDKRMGVFAKVYNLSSFLKKHVPQSSVDECIEYLRKLENSGLIGNANLMIGADRIIQGYSFERVNKIMAGVCRFWETIFDEMQPDVVVGEVACASEWIAWSYARNLRIPYLIPYPGPLPKRFSFVRSPDGGWDEAAYLYKAAKERGLSTHQRERAEAFLNHFRTNRLRSAIHAPAFRSPGKLDRTAIKGIIQRIGRIPTRLRTFLEDNFYEVGSYNGTAPWKPVLQDLLRTAKHHATKALLFDERVLPGKNVYFPLHVQPEFTIDVRAPFCTNQLALVENIAKSIPAGYRLIVKDHPGMRGRRRLSYYRDLQRLYNVQLVSPEMDSHEIIQQSDLVLTIVGTTAWEAILYEKAVIAFGSLAYSFYDQVCHCRTISELPALISRQIQEFTPDRDLLLKFIWATLETAHEAEWHDPLATPAVLQSENISAIAKAIVRDAGVDTCVTQFR